MLEGCYYHSFESIKQPFSLIFLSELKTEFNEMVLLVFTFYIKVEAE